VQYRLGSHSVLMAAEIDCTKEEGDGPIDGHPYVELKTYKWVLLRACRYANCRLVPFETCTMQLHHSRGHSRANSRDHSIDHSRDGRQSTVGNDSSKQQHAVVLSWSP
jgi:hypothetical protein